MAKGIHNGICLYDDTNNFKDKIQSVAILGNILTLEACVRRKGGQGNGSNKKGGWFQQNWFK
jgi:hypothetical protein